MTPDLEMKLIDIAQRLAEFLKNGAPIHPGSLLAVELLELLKAEGLD